jgi:hypothetical protein
VCEQVVDDEALASVMLSLQPEGQVSPVAKQGGSGRGGGDGDGGAPPAVDLRDRLRNGGRWSVESNEVRIAVYGVTRSVKSWYIGELDTAGATVQVSKRVAFA